jgi:hypothetical protein
MFPLPPRPVVKMSVLSVGVVSDAGSRSGVLLEMLPARRKGMVSLLLFVWVLGCMRGTYQRRHGQLMY